MITTFKAKKLLIPAAILTLAVGMYFAKKLTVSTSSSLVLGNQCDFVNLECRIPAEKGVVTAEFMQQPEPEAHITVNFSLPHTKQIKSVWIEGVNMYMGKIPVLTEPSGDGEWSGWFMLGSCSEPSMQWRMLVHVKGQSAPYVLYFHTKMP